MLLPANRGARRKRWNALHVHVLMVLAASCLSAPALAQKPTVVPEIVVPGRIGYAAAEGPHRWSAICQVGEPDTGSYVVDYIYSFPDRYFTLLKFNACPTCVPPDSVRLTHAHTVLEFRRQCPMTFRVAVYGTRPFSGCIRPDTNVVLCPPRTVTVEPPGEGGFFDLSAELAPGCAIARDAYLMIDFLGFSSPCVTNNRPRMVFSNQCPTCEQSYNHYQGGGSWFEDNLCEANRFPNHRPRMYADGDLCVTPAIRQSWRSLKVIYR